MNLYGPQLLYSACNFDTFFFDAYCVYADSLCHSPSSIGEEEAVGKDELLRGGEQL